MNTSNTSILLFFIASLCIVSCNKYDSDFDFVGSWKGGETRNMCSSPTTFSPYNIAFDIKLYADGTGAWEYGKSKDKLYWSYYEEEQRMVLFIEKGAAAKRGFQYEYLTFEFEIIQNTAEEQIWKRNFSCYVQETGEYWDTYI